MPSSASSSAMEAVVHYKKKLMRHVSDQQPDVLLHCLQKLDRVPMTIDILQETGVGRVVNSLKKALDPDSEVAQVARNIVGKWKDIVANHQEQEDPGDPDSQREDDEDEGCDDPPPDDEDLRLPEKDEEPPVAPPVVPPPPISDEDNEPEEEPDASHHRRSHKKSSKEERRSGSSSHKHKRHHKEKDGDAKSGSHSSGSSKKKKKDKDKSRDRDKSKKESRHHHKSGEDRSRHKHEDSKSSSSSSKRKHDKVESDFSAALTEGDSRPGPSKRSSNGVKATVDAYVPSDINPNYKPSPSYVPAAAPNGLADVLSSGRMSTIKRSDDDELSALMSKKGTRKTMYSGVKRSAFKDVPTLKELCIHLLQENVDHIEQCGGLPYDILEPVLRRASPQTLMNIEEYNQYLMEGTGPMWEIHCRRDFPKAEREEFESFREMYERCTRERAEKLELLTAKMGTSYKMAKDSVRRTKMAFVSSAAKPPRNIKRVQERNGTALSQPPAKRGRPPLSAGGEGRGASAQAKKPKIAPMMAKTLKLARGLKGGFRR